MAMDPFQELEDKEGIRWNWRKYPNSKEDAATMVIPLSLLYTPLKNQTVPVLSYEPIMCKGCKGVLSPYCRLDMQSKLWICPFCLTRNQLPPQYQQITQEMCPQELLRTNTTVEYHINRPKAGPPTFLYVIDTCIHPEELESLKDSILQSFSLLPEEAVVGVVTFGSMVTVWEVGFAELHKSYVLGGGREYTVQEVAEYLSVSYGTTNIPGMQQTDTGAKTRFLAPISECELNITSIIEELTVDPWPVKQDSRPDRCTGAAMSVALSMMELSEVKHGGRCVVFPGGAMTKGPGVVVSTDLNETIRTHNEIKMDQAPFYVKAKEYYDKLASRFVKANYTCDMFAACLDQIGVTEMSNCCNATGGHLCLFDSFKTPMFRQSFQKYFSSTDDMAFQATIEVQTSRGTKVAGMIGPCSSLEKITPSVSETENVGVGKTSAWQITAMNSHTTYSIHFDICGASEGQTERYVQMITYYLHSSGTYRLRVCTTSHAISPTAEPDQYLNCQAFDQDCAAVLVARQACAMLEKNGNNVKEAMRWMDKKTINLVKRFGSYQPDVPASLRLTGEFSLFPVFMYHLRRSEFLNIFNSSPDETTFFRHVLCSDNCNNGILMIQPTLHSYSFQGPPAPVLLDSTSIQPDNILLMDTFFHVVIHHGSTIAAWVDQNYHERPEHENFRVLLAAPKTQAEKLVGDRFPAPKLTECKQAGSQARILLNRLNPSVSYTADSMGQASGEICFTDDASLHTFMTHLKKLAVATQPM